MALPRWRGPSGTVIDADLDAACSSHDLVEHSPSRVTDVVELAPGQVPRERRSWILQDFAHEGLVPTHDQTRGYAGRHDPQEVFRDSSDELVGLVAPPARKPLLRPPAGRSARLDVPSADLVQDESGPLDVRDGIPTASDQQDGKVRMLETRNPDDPLGTIGVGDVEALAPRVVTFGRDLNETAH